MTSRDASEATGGTAAQGPGYVTDYFGPLRLAGADAVVVAGAEPAIVSSAQIAAVAEAGRAARTALPLVTVTFRPRPIEPVEGRRVFYATTAPVALLPELCRHLAEEHGCTVVASSPHLADRAQQRAVGE